MQGTLTFLNEEGIRPRPRPEEDEPWDEADSVPAGEQESKSLGPKPTIVIASPVPSGEISYKRTRMAQLQGFLAIRPLKVSYHPQMALIESVFVRDFREEYLAGEYQELATYIMARRFEMIR